MQVVIEPGCFAACNPLKIDHIGFLFAGDFKSDLAYLFTNSLSLLEYSSIASKDLPQNRVVAEVTVSEWAGCQDQVDPEGASSVNHDGDKLTQSSFAPR